MSEQVAHLFPMSMQYFQLVAKSVQLGTRDETENSGQSTTDPHRVRVPTTLTGGAARRRAARPSFASNHSARRDRASQALRGREKSSAFIRTPMLHFSATLRSQKPHSGSGSMYLQGDHHCMLLGEAKTPTNPTRTRKIAEETENLTECAREELKVHSDKMRK